MLDDFPAASAYSVYMQTRRLGSSDLEITSIGLGAWAIGGGEWGPQDDAASIATIHAAIDHGINWIDTAPVYGLGHSEEVVGRAIRGRSNNRPRVFTKCSMVWGDDRQVTNSLKRDSILRECEASLRRLAVDTIDLYQIHWPNPDPDIEEGWLACADLQKSGKIRWIGVSNFNVAQMTRAQAIAPIASLQPPYSIISPEVENAILPYCAQQNIGVIVYSPMKSGLLTGTMTRERIAAFPEDAFRRRALNFREPLLTRNLQIQDKVKEIAARHGRSAGEAAVAWTLRRPEVTGAIVGMRSPQQVEAVIGAAGFRLPQEEIAEIESFIASLASN
jgi:aryl-alcohol dehydrogenase-like predicted oxidoreductase